jgi:hypothetical protein
MMFRVLIADSGPLAHHNLSYEPGAPRLYADRLATESGRVLFKLR